MINRRNFVQGAALAAALARTPPARAHATVASISWVLADPRHGESRAFAASLVRRGAARLELAQGDVTPAWVGALSSAWKSRPCAIAGITRPDALFVLEQLAWSHGLRVVLHAEHLIGAAAGPRHEVLRCVTHATGQATGGATSLGARALALAGTAWPTEVAGVAAAWSRRPVAASAAGPSSCALAPEPPAGAVLLASWIIAPVRTSRS
jgi:hypothetical protein